MRQSYRQSISETGAYSKETDIHLPPRLAISLTLVPSRYRLGQPLVQGKVGSIILLQRAPTMPRLIQFFLLYCCFSSKRRGLRWSERLGDKTEPWLLLFTIPGPSTSGLVRWAAPVDCPGPQSCTLGPVGSDWRWAVPFWTVLGFLDRPRRSGTSPSARHPTGGKHL